VGSLYPWAVAQINTVAAGGKWGRQRVKFVFNGARSGTKEIDTQELERIAFTFRKIEIDFKQENKSSTDNWTDNS
jgi:hypothetical protein